MPIRTKEDGTLSYEFDLFMNPCPQCFSTNITLFENGGKKTTKGGGICNNCFFKVEIEGIPGVPSMMMLLDVWNAATLK